MERIQDDPCLIYMKESAIFPADFICHSEFQIFQELKAGRRENLSQYQKQIAKEHVANVEKELEKWQYGRRGKRTNNDAPNLQEKIDNKIETHRL